MQQPGGANIKWGHILNGGRAPLAPAGNGSVFIIRKRVYFDVQSELI